MAFGRAAFGLALTVETVPLLKVLARDEASQGGNLVMFARTVGIRDLVLGLGTLAASFSGIREMRRWQAACLASDGADALAGSLSSRYIGRGGAVAATGAALPFVAGGSWALLRLPRET
jgi:hypothetical protein